MEAKRLKPLTGFLLLLSLLFSFYLLFHIERTQRYVTERENQSIIIDVLNEIYLTSHRLDELTHQYIRTHDPHYLELYTDTINQTLGVSPRNSQNLYHGKTINLFSIINKRIHDEKLKEQLIKLYEQLLIQNNFQNQSLEYYSLYPFETKEALAILNTTIYSDSLKFIFDQHTAIMHSLDHYMAKVRQLNITLLLTILLTLSLIAFAFLLYAVYKQKSLLKSKMNVTEYINLLVNSMPFVSVLFNDKGEAIGCNKQLLDILDIDSKEEFITNFNSYIAPVQGDLSSKDFIAEKNKLALKDTITSFSWTLVDKHNTNILCDVTSIYLQYDNNKYFIYYAFNSQKELEMQAKIREQEERIQLMLDSNPLCCTIWDDNFNLIDCNMESARLFNLSSKRDYIDNFLKLSPICQPDGQFSVDKYLIVLENAMKTGYERFEWLHQDLNHNLIPTEITLVRIKYRDKCMIAGYTRDLREEKKMINSLKRKQTELIEAKLISEREAKAKSDFLAIMSHEIHTPLNAIINIFGLLSEVEMDSKHHDFVEKGSASANILLHTINDILDYSKIEAGQLSIENISFSLSEILKNVQSLFENQMELKNLQFTVQYDKNLADILLGDPMRITQILINLLSNAMKFTEKGSITVNVAKSQTKEDVINEETQNTITTLRFEVIDTGIGITQSQIKKIFTPFTQADTSTTRKYGGTGLGLSISRNLAKLMNGELNCTSIAGEGSTFFLELPLEIANKQTTQKQNDTKNQGINTLKDLQVLLVEDNQINTIVAMELLKKKEILVDTAINGVEALKKASEKQYDIILMDIQMPQMDGITATKHMRTELNITTPIIAMTANVLEEDKKLYMQSGFNAHIGKPIVPLKLYEILADFDPRTTKD